jgi:hypothetical protein
VFQGIETGIFVAVAALLLYLAVRRIRRIARPCALWVSSPILNKIPDE